MLNLDASMRVVDTRMTPAIFRNGHNMMDVDGIIQNWSSRLFMIIPDFWDPKKKDPMMLAVPCSRDGAHRIAPARFPLTWPRPSRSFLCVRDACSKAHLPP